MEHKVVLIKINWYLTFSILVLYVMSPSLLKLFLCIHSVLLMIVSWKGQVPLVQVILSLSSIFMIMDVLLMYSSRPYFLNVLVFGVTNIEYLN